MATQSATPAKGKGLETQLKTAALKEMFPHIEHDDDFRTAITAQLETIHTELKHISWLFCAEDLREKVTRFSERPYYVENPDQIPNDFRPLVALFPAYKIMAHEAEADQHSWCVRLGGKSRLQKDPSCWVKRIAQLRAAMSTTLTPSGMN